MGWSKDIEFEVEREVRRLKDKIPREHHEKLENVTLQRALRLYGDRPDALATELGLVCACIQPDESDFETLLEGAFVAVPSGFSYDPESAKGILNSRLDKKPCAEPACGVHAVNPATLEQYFRHGGVIPHFRDGKWRIELTPYPPRSNGEKQRTGSAARRYSLNEKYAQLHGFVGYLAAQRVIKRERDDYFGRQRLEQADELYRRCVEHYKKYIEEFPQEDLLSLRPLKDLLVSRLGVEEGAKIFVEASHSCGVRIVFNEEGMRYFEPSEKKEGAYAEHLPFAGSLVLKDEMRVNQNEVLPFSAVFSILFNDFKNQARKFRKRLAQSHHPKSIFRMYLK